jgi:hypothetical protein
MLSAKPDLVAMIELMLFDPSPVDEGAVRTLIEQAKSLVIRDYFGVMTGNRIAIQNNI